ncbi:hypothetical protein KUTeg_023019 [Tegillarca granosa]|uniref:Endonuclease/exonuclease/phosphatase domain-containing protein n=1 Tax=Tegillarca granosa TaxID=220873 RepID=A0ABQ9E0V4_TEGGR|nr:hypothetical protein KUTeg_023019 [Tegillarca granosa]
MSNFEIVDFNEFSDHAPISFSLSYNIYDSVINKFTDSLFDCAYNVIGKRRRKIFIPKQQSSVNKWLSECRLCRELFNKHRNAYIRDKTDSNRRLYMNTRGKYNLVKRKARRASMIHQGNKLHEMAKSAPKEFWKNVKKLRKSKPVSSQTNLNVNDFDAHFRLLSGENNTHVTLEDNPNDHVIQNDLIDQAISTDEVISAIKSLKSVRSLF